MTIKPFTAVLAAPSLGIQPMKIPKLKSLGLVRSLRMDFIVQELCESRGGRPGLSVITSLLVSVGVKIYCTVLRHWSQLVPNISNDI